jgi:GAF domain-containing protein
MILTKESGMEIRKVWAESAKLIELTGSDAPLADVLTEVVSAARAITDSGCRSALFIHDIDESCLNVGVNGGLPKGYVDAIQGFKVGEHQPSCGRAVFIADEVIVPEINLDSRWAPYTGLAEEHSIQACWSFPILSDSTVLGTLAVYHDGPTEPNSVQLQAMRYLATIAAAAIGRSKIRAMFQEEIKTLPVTADHPEPGSRSGAGMQSIRDSMRGSAACAPQAGRQ